MKIAGAGLLALDAVVSRDRETSVRYWAGGTCGNVMAISSYLGWEALAIGRLSADHASKRLISDLQACGVDTRLVSSGWLARTPIIQQRSWRGRDSLPRHRFSWACPVCGRDTAPFRPLTYNAARSLLDRLNDINVFFFDRLSPSTLLLAKHFAAAGALVMYEPSGRVEPKQLQEVFNYAHIIKYPASADGERFAGAFAPGTAICLEVKTLGASGLTFRYRRRGTEVSDWLYVSAPITGNLVDTSGAGDWCTAGFLAKAAGQGKASFAVLDTTDIALALSHGQQLAAWNCRFEGARGAMYGSRADAPLELTALTAEKCSSSLRLSFDASDLSVPCSTDCGKRSCLTEECRPALRSTMGALVDLDRSE